MNKSINILQGRGIEGTGNTKFTIELHNHIKNNYYENVQTIAGCDKKWGRNKAHDNEIQEYKFGTQHLEVFNKIKHSDIILITSVPAKNYSDEAKENFHELLKKLKDNGSKLVYLQVDHKIHSINRNYYVEEKYKSFFEIINGVITATKDGDFEKWLNKNNIKVDIDYTLLGSIDFEKNKVFIKSFEEKENKSIRFLGRSAAWKGPWLARDIQSNHLKNNGYKLYLEGIELSIGVLGELYKEIKPNRILRDDVTFDASDTSGKTIILPPYNNKDGLERLSRSMFGIELLTLPDIYLKNLIEIAMLEIPSVGTIPIFRKKWGETFIVNGKPIIEQDCGTIFLDENNPWPAITAMEIISKNKMMYEATAKLATKFYGDLFNTNKVMSNLFDIIWKKY